MPTPLEEALTAVGASALIQKRIDPTLLELQRRYSPLTRCIPTEPWNSTVYYFNNRTSQPAGGFVTDGGARPVSTSVYNQNQYPIKLLQSVGAVTGYAQAVTADLIGNLRAREIEGAARGLYWDVENGITWGNAASTLGGPYPQYDGLDTIAATFTSAQGPYVNAINFNGGNLDLGTLDQLIDLVEQNVSEDVENSNWMFVCSPTVVSRVAQLLTNQQRFVNMVTVATGLDVQSYRNIPFVKSSFLSPRGVSVGTVTAAAVNSGGSLVSATYYYKVNAIIDRFGATLASAECSATTTGSGVITLTLPAAPTWETSVPNKYGVYRSTTAGQETFLGYVDANVALQSDGITPVVTNQIVDNGVTLIAQNSSGPTQPATYPASYSVIGANTALFPAQSGWQNVYLMSRDPNYIVRPYVREFMPVDVYPTTASPDSLPFATVTDTTLAVRAPSFLGRAANVVVQLAS